MTLEQALKARIALHRVTPPTNQRMAKCYANSPLYEKFIPPPDRAIISKDELKGCIMAPVLEACGYLGATTGLIRVDALNPTTIRRIAVLNGIPIFRKYRAKVWLVKTYQYVSAKNAVGAYLDKAIAKLLTEEQQQQQKVAALIEQLKKLEPQWTTEDQP